MGNQRLKGMARIWAAFRNSAAGFGDIWRGEEAFRQECMAFVVAVPAAFWLGKDAFAAALLIASVLFILVVEVLNSAIEAVVDRIGPERHDLSRMAKDLGSLAVLLAALLAGMLWLAAVYVRFVG